MQASTQGPFLAGAVVGLVVVSGALLAGFEPLIPPFERPEPVPVAGHVETCADAAPIVRARLGGWGLTSAQRGAGEVDFAGTLVGPSAAFAARNLDALITAMGHVSAIDPTGRVVIEDDEIAEAAFSVQGLGSFTLHLKPSEAARRRLAEAGGERGLPALTWSRDGERIGTSAPGLPAPGQAFDIRTDPRQAAVTMALIPSGRLPCPARLARVR